MHGRPRLRRSLPAAALALVATACGSGDPLDDVEAAPAADDPSCAAVLERLPDVLDGRTRVELDVAGAAAYGDPPAVVRCGVEPVGATTRPCVQVDGVDWVLLEGGEEPGPVTAATFGREPAVEVRLPASDEPPGDALLDLGPAVEALPQGRACS